METIFIYLIKASGLIAAFFVAYYFLLRKETFFKTNRWFLLSGLFASVLLPLVTFTKIIWIEPAPQQLSWTNVPVTPAPTVETYEINWFLVAAMVYAIGIIIFLFRFVFDFNNLIKVLRGKTVTQQADFKYIDVAEKVSPFSYFNYIVYNSSMYTEAELENILEHERVHCEQMHSADVLVSRIFCILFWYNPFVWLYQKAILQNLEFIADSEALKNITDKKAYQITLLKVTTHDNCVAITNHFYQSLIKKRIIMLNKNQSKKWNSWKYALIIPVLVAFILYFQVKVIAQERNHPNVVSTASSEGSVVVTVDKNTSDAEMKKDAEALKDKYGIKLKFSKVKRNSAGEIVAIKAVYKDKDNKSGIYQVSGDEPIKPLRFYKNDDGAMGFGNSKQVRIAKNRSHNDNDEEQIITVVTSDDVEAPEPPETPDGVAPAEAPEPPARPKDVKVIVKKSKDKDGKMSITVNGEPIDVDVDKIVSEATANMDFDFNFDFDSDEVDDSTREAFAKARLEVEKVRPQMERAREQMRKMRPEREQARQEMEQARIQLEQSRAELEQSRRELEQAKKEFETQKAKQAKAKK